MIARLLIAVLVLASYQISPTETKPSVMLGVLEELPGPYQSAPTIRAVSTVFQKTGNDWKEVSGEYPREITWTITFDGKKLGEVSSRPLKEFKHYHHPGQQEIIGTGAVPTVGKESIEYGGQLEVAVHRPLVAVSQPYFQDPEAWKQATISSVFLLALRARFHKQFPSLCRLNNQEDSIKKPWHYPDEEIKLVRAYSSKKGWSVARLHLENVRDCADVEAGFQIDDPWFAVDPNKTVKFIGAGIWLVNAGDYDNDGKSEILFAINRDNRGGYELFYDDFKKHAVFEYSYH